MSHTVSVIGLFVFVGCANVADSETSSNISAADDAYSGNSSDLAQPMPSAPPANAPIRSGYYAAIESYSFITIDVASPKDGSDTWTLGIYGEDHNCNNPFLPWDLQTDGRATIECAESGRCWFNVDHGTYYAWSPGDPNEVTLFHPVAGSVDTGVEDATYVWVRDIDSSDTSCDCLPVPPPSSPPPAPAYQGPPTVSNPDPPFSSFESPLVVSFSDSPLQFSGTAVGFDFYANGSRPLVDWILPPAGLLALDLDGNGTIDTGRELFGTSTLLSSHQLASNGFAALAQYDANHDGQIDARDPIYAQLVVWTDRNRDGISQPDELVGLAATGIASIPLQSTDTSHEPIDQLGTYVGSWVAVDYHARGVCTRASITGFVSDVWFAANAPAPTTAPSAPDHGPVGVDANGNLDAAIVQCFLRNGGAAAIGTPTNQVHAWATGVPQAHVVLLDSYRDTQLVGGSTGGVAQDFTGGSLGSSICMHETERASAAMVRGWIRDAYFNAGGATSFLGYPVGDEYVDDSLPLPYNQIQQFDGGYIAWDPYESSFAPFDRNGCDSAYCASVAMCQLKTPSQCPY